MLQQPSRIPFDQLNYNDDGLYVLVDFPYTGVAYREESDILRYEQEYRNGLPWGKGLTWWDSGKLRLTMSYYEGALHGTKTESDETGELLKEEVYEFGVILVRRKRIESGGLVDEFRLRRSDPGFKTLSTLRNLYPDEVLNIDQMTPDLIRVE